MMVMKTILRTMMTEVETEEAAEEEEEAAATRRLGRRRRRLKRGKTKRAHLFAEGDFNK